MLPLLGREGLLVPCFVCTTFYTALSVVSGGTEVSAFVVAIGSQNWIATIATFKIHDAAYQRVVYVPEGHRTAQFSFGPKMRIGLSETPGDLASRRGQAFDLTLNQKC